ncbi:MAG: HigA family addiction module antitoxin [Patescibacteria group bacterium]
MPKIPNIHPGEILFEEFLKPMGISAYRLAKETRLPATRVSEIIHKKRGITAETALRFAKFFETTPEFWLGLQQEYDLRNEQKNFLKGLNFIASYTKFMNTAVSPR